MIVLFMSTPSPKRVGCDRRHHNIFATGFTKGVDVIVVTAIYLPPSLRLRSWRDLRHFHMSATGFTLVTFQGREMYPSFRMATKLQLLGLLSKAGRRIACKRMI